MKKFGRKKCWKMFLEAIFFAFERTFLGVSVQIFCHCFTRYHWPTKFLIVFLPIIIQNYDVEFALVLHLNCSALSQSESSNFFKCNIS